MSKRIQSPIIVALDGMGDEATTMQFVKKIAPHVAGVKVGDAIISHGSFICTQIEYAAKEGAEDIPRIEQMADLKIHDIPKTVGNAVKILDGYTYITVHACNSLEALRVARDTAKHAMLLGITLLTSIDGAECMELYGRRPKEHVQFLARRSMNAGFDGIVCSGKELQFLNESLPNNNLKLVVPGTRSPGTPHHDQERIVTPAEAMRDGAYRLVIGREITDAEDPIAAAQNINYACAQYM